ncbi:MAG: DUF433 domain-containing protein [Pseudonocardiales bacterium]|nr:DUF433 domain-containing protein [Pseudonocardiales bacterium]
MITELVSEFCISLNATTPNIRVRRLNVCARELVVVRRDQRVFTEIVDSYLQRIDFHDDQWARVIHLPKYRPADVIVDQKRGFGAPIFARGGVRLETVLAAFKRGARINELTDEYGVPEADLLDVLRVHTDAA